MKGISEGFCVGSGVIALVGGTVGVLVVGAFVGGFVVGAFVGSAVNSSRFSEDVQSDPIH